MSSTYDVVLLGADHIGVVETEYENVFLCGSSARRGGAVSDIPGHKAAMKVLGVCKTGQ